MNKGRLDDPDFYKKFKEDMKKVFSIEDYSKFCNKYEEANIVYWGFYENDPDLYEALDRISRIMNGIKTGGVYEEIPGFCNPGFIED